MKKNLFATLILGLLCQFGFAQSFDKAKLDSYFDALETNNKFMGSVAVSKSGKIIYERSLGYIEFENKIKANANSKYRIGSISKTFTAVLVLKAVEKKLLDLNQTIETYFPSVKNADKITLKHLLSHRSGIHNFTDDPGYLTWNTQVKTEKEMLAIIADAGSDFEPDSKAQYSNSNYVLLSFILEKGFNKPYAELLQSYITKPLALKNTYFGGKINTANNECFSYTMSETWQVAPETDMSVPLGAGGIVSTPGDLVTFSDALFGGKLLKSESLTLMKSINDQYGIGLFQFPFYDYKGYGHTGGIDGFSSVFTHFPDGSVSYALTSNGTNVNNNNISIAVLSAVYNKPYEIPEFLSFNVSDETLDSYLGSYISEQVPLKITITKNKHTLIAQATGQAAFPLEATAKDKFKFEQAGIEMEFNPDENTMLLKQGGAQFNFKKE
jgi:CubicO group peptidase (beta-lactamase class C family)